MATTFPATDAAADGGIKRLQAVFRGNKSRRVHLERVRRGLPWSPFVPAKMEAVDDMLALAAPQPGEKLVDIGSGDGRVVLAAASKFPQLAQAIGIELDPALVVHSLRRAAEVTATRVSFIQGDFLDVDMADVNIVVLFFLPHEQIARVLSQKLRPGTRVVTYVFRIAQWKPERSTTTVPFMTERGSSPIYLYRVPPSA